MLAFILSLLGPLLAQLLTWLLGLQANKTPIDAEDRAQLGVTFGKMRQCVTVMDQLGIAEVDTTPSPPPVPIGPVCPCCSMMQNDVHRILMDMGRLIGDVYHLNQRINGVTVDVVALEAKIDALIQSLKVIGVVTTPSPPTQNT
jgi:uncharacterized membrane protein